MRILAEQVLKTQVLISGLLLYNIRCWMLTANTGKTPTKT